VAGDDRGGLKESVAGEDRGGLGEERGGGGTLFYFILFLCFCSFSYLFGGFPFVVGLLSISCIYRAGLSIN